MQRRERFQRYLSESGSEDPAAIDLASLGRAQSLATGDDEKAAVFAIRRRYSEWDRAVKAKHSNEVQSALAQIQERLDQLEDMPAADLTTDEFQQIIEQIDVLPRQFPRRGRLADDQIDVVRTRAIALRNAVSRAHEVNRAKQLARDRLADSRTLQTFAQNLAAYSRDVPSSIVADEYMQAADELPLWTAALHWNRLGLDISEHLNGGLGPEEAKSLVERLNEYESRAKGSPILADGKVWREHLQFVIERPEIIDQVFGDLKESPFAKLVTVQETTGNRYFVFESHFDQKRDSMEGSAPIGIEVVVDQSAAVRLKGLERPLSHYPDPSRFIRMLVETTDNQRDEFLHHWEEEFLEKIAGLVKRETLDGLIKEMLLLHLLEGAAEGSQFLSHQLADELAFLRGRRDERRHWYEPREFDSSLNEVVEARVIRQCAESYRSLHDAHTVLRRLATTRVAWVGWVRRNASGVFTCHMKSAPETSGELWIVERLSDEQGTGVWRRVATWDGNSAELKTKVGLVAGRPLFFIYEGSVADSRQALN